MLDRFKVVEDDCIGCGLCSERALENLEMCADTRTAQVIKQPETPEEEQACLDACDYCPMGGIHAGAADSSAGGTDPASTPGGDTTPVGITLRRLEN